MSSSKTAPNAYEAADIQHLEGLEAIRRRPGMYIGDTAGRGLHHLLREVLDNAVDEALVGACTRIEIVLEPGGWVGVSDNGRGIPVAPHPKFKVSTLEAVCTKLHMGGKMGSGAYRTSGGLHGIGIKAVNALSEQFEVTSEREGGRYKAVFKTTSEKSIGIIQRPGVQKIGKSRQTGTAIRWKADPRVFHDTTYDRDVILQMIREKAFLTPGLYLVLRDESADEWAERHFCFEGGIKTFVRHMVQGRGPLHPDPLVITKRFENGGGSPPSIAVSLQYTESTSEQLLAFTNNVPNPEGGQHVTGFRTALTRVLNEGARELGVLKPSDPNLTGEDVREGLCCVINLLMDGDKVEFEGQTKGRLGNQEARGWADAATAEMLKEAIARQPETIKTIIGKCLESFRAREAMKKAADAVRRKGVLEGAGMPGKLTDCRATDPARSELFIVEGLSAGGSAKDARDPETQAILPLRGKILNVERVQTHKVLDNEEIRNLLRAIGGAEQGVGSRFDPDRVRYHRVVLMADADDDGAHITTLLMTAFFRLMPGLIERGYLYVARPPLYALTSGKRLRYAYTDAERDALLRSEMKGAKVQRYKGLGEMNADQLRVTTMDPASRQLQRVTYEDIAHLEKTVTTLMGNDTDERKHYISAHAKDVGDLEFIL